MITWLFTQAIRLYRRVLGPLIPPCCRFQPTCSHYAEESLHRHGAWKGSILAGWRLLRCNPWGESGWDPVPPTGAWREAFTRRLRACRPAPAEGDPHQSA